MGLVVGGWYLEIQKLYLKFKNRLRASWYKLPNSNFIKEQLDVFRSLWGMGASAKSVLGTTPASELPPS